MRTQVTSLTLIQSLERGLHLVDLIAKDGPMSASALSASTGIAKSTTYHLLKTLVLEGYLSRVTGGRYALGPQLGSVLHFEARARQFRLVGDAITTLSTSTGGSVVIGVLEAGERVAVRKFVANPNAPRFPCWPGMELASHATAVGKSILRQIPSEDRERHFINHPLDPLTRKTPATYWRLEQDLNEHDDVVVSDEQYRYGLSCIGAAIGYTQPAAIAAAFGSTRSERARERIASAVREAAARITMAMSDNSDELVEMPPLVPPDRSIDRRHHS